MSTNLNNENEKPQPPKKKFNFYWLYGLAALLLLALQFNTFMPKTNQPINPTRFNELLEQNDVKSVTLVKTTSRNFVEVTLTDEALKKDEFKDMDLSRAPHFQFDPLSV